MSSNETILRELYKNISKQLRFKNYANEEVKKELEAQLNLIQQKLNNLSK